MMKMNKEIVYWITKTGEKISIDDMDETHLRNTLKFILGKMNTKPKPKIKLKGDMANEFNNTYPEDDYYDPFNDDMDDFMRDWH